MTTATTENKVLEFFQTEAIGNASPNQGYGAGGWRPAEGDHDCMLTGMKQELGDFRYTDADEKKQKADAGIVTFLFRLLDDPDNPDDPRSWQGKPFVMPKIKLREDPKLPEGQKMRIRIQDERLAGYFNAILGHVPKTGAVGIQMIGAKIMEADEQNAAVCVRMNCRYDVRVRGKGEDKREISVFDEEFCRELITE